MASTSVRHVLIALVTAVAVLTATAWWLERSTLPDAAAAAVGWGEGPPQTGPRPAAGPFNNVGFRCASDVPAGG